MAVTQRDSASIGVARAGLANSSQPTSSAAIRNERLRYEPGTLLRSGIYGLLRRWPWAARCGSSPGSPMAGRGTGPRFRERRLKPFEFTGRTGLGRETRAIDVLVRVIRLVLILWRWTCT